MFYFRFYQLIFWNGPPTQKSLNYKKPILRFWASAMINNNYPESLRNWNDFYIER